MDAPLQEAFNQSKFSATLSLHLYQAYDRLVASSTFSYNGGIFLTDETFVMWVKLMRDEINALQYNEEEKLSAIILDKNNKPIKIDDINEFSTKVFNLRNQAVTKYYSEYTALVKERTIKKVVKADV